MNAYIAPAQTPAPTRRHRATAPWVLAVLSPVAFVVLMETFEFMSMSGSGPDIPDAVGLAIYFVLVALLPATAIALGVRAIRRGDRGRGCRRSCRSSLSSDWSSWSSLPSSSADVRLADRFCSCLDAVGLSWRSRSRRTPCRTIGTRMPPRRLRTVFADRPSSVSSPTRRTDLSPAGRAYGVHADAHKA